MLELLFFYKADRIMQNTNSTNQDQLLNEILPLSADKIIADRFSAVAQAEAGSCSGSCNGTCSAG